MNVSYYFDGKFINNSEKIHDSLRTFPYTPGKVKQHKFYLTRMFNI